MATALGRFLSEARISYAAFAPRIGVANGSVVYRYAQGRFPRRKDVREAIIRETQGKVTLQDLLADGGE